MLHTKAITVAASRTRNLDEAAIFQIYAGAQFHHAFIHDHQRVLRRTAHAAYIQVAPGIERGAKNQRIAWLVRALGGEKKTIVPVLRQVDPFALGKERGNAKKQDERKKYLFHNDKARWKL